MQFMWLNPRILHLQIFRVFHHFPLQVDSLLKTVTEIGEWLKNHEQRLAFYHLVKGFLLRKD